MIEMTDNLHAWLNEQTHAMERLKAENAKLRAALEAWYNACQVDALMSGPIVKVSHIKAQNAWTLTCAALNTEKEKKG